VLVKRIGKERIYAEAVDSHIGNWFWDAAAQTRIRPVSQPEYGYSLPQSSDTPWEFTATVVVQPKPELPDWKALDVPFVEAEVPAELVDHNCLLYGGLTESANWPFVGPDGPFSVAVRGNLSSNSVETIRAGVLDGVGIGLFARVSLADELRHPDVIAVLEDFIGDVRDISVIWPRRRFVPARVRRVTDFFAAALPQRV